MELFMQWFVPSVAIVSAVAFIPFMFVFTRYFIELCGVLCAGAIDYFEEERLNKILLKRWYLVSVKKCPNPDYLSFTYRQAETGKVIEISHNVNDARKMMEGKE